VTNLFLLVPQSKINCDRASANTRQSFDLANFHLGLDNISDKKGRNELPLANFTERNHGAIQDACLPGKA